jgi:hypothetical protein
MPKEEERRRATGGAVVMVPDEVRRSTVDRGVADGVVEVDRVPSRLDEPVRDVAVADCPLSLGLVPLPSSMSVVISAIADATAMAVARPMDVDRLRPLGTLRTVAGTTT